MRALTQTPIKAPAGPHKEQVSRSDPAQPDRLQSRADATDGDGTEHGPGQVRIGSAARSNDDSGDKDDACYAENDQLQAATQRHKRGRTLVGFVLNIRSALLVTVAHDTSLGQPTHTM